MQVTFLQNCFASGTLCLQGSTATIADADASTLIKQGFAVAATSPSTNDVVGPPDGTLDVESLSAAINQTVGATMDILNNAPYSLSVTGPTSTVTQEVYDAVVGQVVTAPQS